MASQDDGITLLPGKSFFAADEGPTNTAAERMYKSLAMSTSCMRRMMPSRAYMASLEGFITSSPRQGQQTPCKVCDHRQSHTSYLPLQQSELLESGNSWA